MRVTALSGREYSELGHLGVVWFYLVGRTTTEGESLGSSCLPGRLLHLGLDR